MPEVDRVAEPVQRLTPAATDILLCPTQRIEAPVAQVGDDSVPDPALPGAVLAPPDVDVAGILEVGLVDMVDAKGE